MFIESVDDGSFAAAIDDIASSGCKLDGG